MIHYVTPQRSDDPAFAPAADPAPPPARGSGEAPPGPISWEIDAPAPPPPAIEPPPPSSWDAVPHPLGHIPEPPAAPAVPAADPRPAAVPAAEEPPPEAARQPRRIPAPPDPEPELVAATVHSLGPVGRRHSVVLAFGLAVVTLGLHPVLWVRRANREMAQFDPRMVVRPGRSAAAIAVASLLPLAVALAEGARIVADRLGQAPSLPVSAQLTRWLLVAPALTPLLAVLIPFSLVAATMTLERVRVVEDRAGVDPEQQLRPSACVWWTAVPLVGLALLVSRGQARLNRVWEACSAPRPR